jgi:hypothetical protein
VELTIFGTYRALQNCTVAGMAKQMREFLCEMAYAMMLARNVLVYAQRFPASFEKRRFK